MHHQLFLAVTQAMLGAGGTRIQMTTTRSNKSTADWIFLPSIISGWSSDSNPCLRTLFMAPSSVFRSRLAMASSKPGGKVQKNLSHVVDASQCNTCLSIYCNKRENRKLISVGILRGWRLKVTHVTHVFLGHDSNGPLPKWSGWVTGRTRKPMTHFCWN